MLDTSTNQLFRGVVTSPPSHVSTLLVLTIYYTIDYHYVEPAIKKCSPQVRGQVLGGNLVFAEVLLLNSTLYAFLMTDPYSNSPLAKGYLLILEATSFVVHPARAHADA